MKKIIALSLLCVFTLTTIKATDLTNAESAYVTAPSGLTLREAPNRTSRVLEIIPFGESVNIILDDSSEMKTERIDWVKGQWIKVNFEGIKGFVFDGYLSNLPVPLMDFELVDSDLDFTYAFHSWMDYRFTEVTASDTIIRENDFTKVIHHFENDQELIEKDGATFFMVDATLSNVRITDVYNLLLSMMPNDIHRKHVQDSSVFIEDNFGELTQIKLLLDNPVKIKKQSNGQINIKLYSNYTGCSL